MASYNDHTSGNVETDYLHYIFNDGLFGPGPGEVFIIKDFSQLYLWIFHNSTISFFPPPSKRNTLLLSSVNGDVTFPITNIDFEVLLSDGQVITLYINSDANVHKLKKVIKSKKNMKIKQQKLIYNGMILDNSSVIRDIGFIDGQINHLRLIEIEDNMRSSVKLTSLYGKDEIYDINTDDHVYDVKNKVANRLNIDIDNISIVYNGIYLNNDELIKDYYLDSNCTLHLLIKEKDKKAFIQISANLFSPQYNYKFPIIDHDVHMRGNNIYYRPLGYKRVGINIEDNIEGREWIGSNNNANEWGVVYHGNIPIDYEKAELLGLSINSNNNYTIGSGVYCSKNISNIEPYCTSFEDPGSHIKYRVVIQSRVDYSKLIQIDQHDQSIDLFLLESENYVRPYSICYIEDNQE